MLIGSTRVIRVWAFVHPVDLRKGYNGLYRLASEELGRNPLNGELFLFVNRRRNSCKVLFWDGTGLCIFQKRLEQGRFARFETRADSHEIALTASELALYLEGADMTGRLSPAEVRF